MEIESRVTAVTVYQGRAMITRRAEVRLEAGRFDLIFTDLPAGLEQESIQVKGRGEATLGECRFETRYFTEDVDTRKRPMLKKRRRIQDDLIEIDASREACTKETGFLDSIAAYVTTPIAENGTGLPADNSAPSARFNSSTWETLLSFYHTTSADLNQRRLEADAKHRLLEEELEQLEAELDSLGYANQHSRNTVSVGIEKETAGDLEIELSYIIQGPSWRPIYSLRAHSDDETLALEYDAIINQATGEDWSGVELKLSTARVNVSGVLPALEPWRLRFYTPEPVYYGRVRSKAVKMEEAPDESLKAGSADELDMAAEASMPPELMVDEAEVETGGASVLFTVAGGGSIDGDNRDTRVSILRRELPADFHYATVPKLAEYAYLSALFTNETEFPLLPGEASIFIDGSFVSKSEFSLVMPGQVTEVSLGVDEGVAVEYRYLGRFKKNEGLVNKKVSEQFEYQIRITNNRSRTVEIKVYEQFPISEEKEITVKRIAPLIKDNQPELSLDDEMKIEWKLTLSPAEKRELPYGFLVEYPVGSTLQGI